MGGLYKLPDISGVEPNVTKDNLLAQELNKGASLVGIHDINNLLEATDVEGAL